MTTKNTSSLTGLVPSSFFAENSTSDKDVQVSQDGITLNYDKLTVPKTFTIQPGGVSWTDGVLNYNTGLGRLAAIQEAFQAVELPPNAFTLKVNDSVLLTDGITDSSVLNKTSLTITNGTNQITLDNSVPSISITDGVSTNTITANPAGASSLADVLLVGNSAGATDIDLNDNTLLKCAEITSTADLLLNPTGSIDANGKTLNMTNGEIHNCPLIHSQNNADITIEAKGT